MRLSRVMRMARLLQLLPELLIMIKGLGAAMRSVLFTLMLLALFLYVFGIAFKQIAGETTAGELYFASIWQSIHTLLLHGALLYDFGDLVEALLNESFLLVLLFYFFILLAALTVMNMLIGVLCEIVSSVSATEREASAVAFVSDTLKQILDSCDMTEGTDEMISKDEFTQILHKDEAICALQACGVDVYALVDNLDFIFAPEPGEVTERTLSFVDFMDLILALRGTNIATVKDILDLQRQLKSTFERLKVKRLGRGKTYSNLSSRGNEEDGATRPRSGRLRSKQRLRNSKELGGPDVIRTLLRARNEISEFVSQVEPILRAKSSGKHDVILHENDASTASGSGPGLTCGRPEEAWSREALRRSTEDLVVLQRSLDAGLHQLLRRSKGFTSI
mmetsp:Transcript_1292/g.3334  ORF Transcript_1292/g.3334 Transcript_1292/m.3334 type:complete len:392 (-) Transcript_1292:50-1225(-)